MFVIFVGLTPAVAEIPGDLFPIQSDLPLDDMTARLRQKPHNCQRYGCFPGAGLTHKAQRFSRLDLEAHIIYSLGHPGSGLVVYDQVFYFQDRFTHILPLLLKPWIQRVAQAIAEKVQRKHGDHDGNAREDQDVGTGTDK